MTDANRYRIRQHVGKHKRGYSVSVVVVAFVIVQMVWDISANDLAQYCQPIFTRLLGVPPTP